MLMRILFQRFRVYNVPVNQIDEVCEDLEGFKYWANVIRFRTGFTSVFFTFLYSDQLFRSVPHSSQNISISK